MIENFLNMHVIVKHVICVIMYAGVSKSKLKENMNYKTRRLDQGLFLHVSLSVYVCVEFFIH